MLRIGLALDFQVPVNKVRLVDVLDVVFVSATPGPNLKFAVLA